MLDSITISHFKSYVKQTLYLSPLTLLIGANASGKSNAIEAFRFLSWLSQGQKLSTLQHRVDDSEQVLRGRIQDLGYMGSKSFQLGCTTTKSEWNTLSVEITHRSGELHISGEKMTTSDQKTPLYEVVQAAEGISSDIPVAYNNFARGGKKPQITCTDQISVMCQLASAARFEKGHKKAQQVIPETTNQYQAWLSNTLFLDPVPQLMRSESYPDKTLRNDCANLSGVLYSLWQEKQNQKIILNLIQSLPEQDIISLDFFKDRKGQVAIELVESFGHKEQKWAVELLSDGTLRVLAIAAALLSVSEGSTIVIEEVDNGIHPSRAKKLLETIRTLASQRNVRLLLSTHNPAMMDALPDEALRDVIFCYRDQEQGTSQLKRLGDISDLPSLASQGSLGSLVTKGVLDRFMKHPTTPDEKKAKALAWLDKMRGDRA